MPNYRYKNLTFSDLKASIEQMDSWADWERFQGDFFQYRSWPETPVEHEDNRKEVILIDGVEWTKFYSPYAIEPELSLLNEKSRLAAFQRFEPAAAAENARKPELYGKYCYRCLRWTRDLRTEFCPVCGFELVQGCLNED